MTTASRLFELRTYHAAPGKLDALQARFRDHTLALFDRHGLEVVGFWTPVDADDTPTGSLVYLLAFADREAAQRAWTGFRHDPDWAEVKARSEEDGVLAESIESVFLTATDYSPLR